MGKILNCSIIPGARILMLVCMGYFLLNCCSSLGPDELDTVKEDPSLAQDIQPIFNNSCALSGCHNSAASAGLNLTREQAYADLVNVAALQGSNNIRVVPYSAKDSYLVIKLEDRQETGSRMPLGGPRLSQNKILNIRNWINRGAKNN